MKSPKNILPFIVLNIIVSVLTTLLVLMIWDRIKQAELPSLLPNMATPVANLPVASTQDLTTSTLPPLDQKLVEISNVMGMGDLKTEVVWLKHTGNGPLDLTGWKLLDENKHEFVFSNFLFYEGAIRIYTAVGDNTSSIDLYWGLAEPIWTSGEKVTLQDPQGNIRATYVIP
ncbi:MAG: lamin tail domain-containing protein [Anaerolineaceae bacterium]|nr:lamin tail domain-containing protein [Anaerolineaceae bacterium]